MAFNPHVQVVRTYGRHKKRTIAAWISPEADDRARHIFSSPESYSFTTTGSTNCHSNALTNSSSGSKSTCSSLHTDEEWFPGKRAEHRAKMALKERNAKPTQAKKKQAPAGRKGAARRQTHSEKENRVEHAAQTVEELPPTAKGKRLTKLSRKANLTAAARGSSHEDSGTARTKPESYKKKFDLIHSPIERSFSSSSKRERRESSDVPFDNSCDLFSYSADVSDASSCASDKFTPAHLQKTRMDDIVFGTPEAFPHSRQNGCSHGHVDTSTPNDLRRHQTKATNSLGLLSTRRVTRSSHRQTEVSGTQDSSPDVPAETESQVVISVRDAGNPHRVNCRCLACKTRHSPDLSDITNEISTLNLEGTNDGAEKAQRWQNSNRRCLSVDEVISPCSVVVTPLSRDDLSQFLTSSAVSCPRDLVGSEKQENEEEEIEGTQEMMVLSDSFCHSFKEVLTPAKSKTTGRLFTAKQKVLQQCDQRAPISFSQGIPPAMMRGCVKIGEGVYGEVFRTVNARGETVALKIIPIEGDFQVNGEPQKSFEEILPEIVISRELSALNNRGPSSTGGFITVNDVSCCQGSYPKILLGQWDEYNARKESENDRPDLFPENQLFIVFEFADGGVDLESKKLESVHQAVSIFQQVATSLAVAEESLEFEHRDLHWGNLLVLPTSEKTISFWLEGEEIKVVSHGVQVGMIDFTLSRLEKDGCTVYCDLSNDETLFTGRGDPQFDVYRKMKEENDNNWEPWNSHTNVLWLHYLLDKLLNGKTYPRTKSDPAQSSLRRELRGLGRHLLGHLSAVDVVGESGLLQL